jgi:hypothetical protein
MAKSQVNLYEQLPSRDLRGEVEFIIKDRNGNVLRRHREQNLIKVFGKEMLSHTLPYSKIWNPDGGTGSGAWEDSGIDALEEFAAKYIIFGASFDDDGQPLDTADSRYYATDPNTGGPVAITPDVGADNAGGLINAIPISEPDRPLKRIENVSFEASYQPADSPLVQDNVRAMNNVLVLETTLRLDEYNGFGTTTGDFFTITEVSLAGGAPLTDIGACECDPDVLFLEGVGGAKDAQIIATANGSATVSIDPSVASIDVARIVEGDQVFLVGRPVGTDEEYLTLDQVQPYYLVTAKAAGGRDVTLDRTPVDSAGTPLTGDIALYRSTLRLFSQRILSVPFKKSSDFEIIVRWRISFA